MSRLVHIEAGASSIGLRVRREGRPGRRGLVLVAVLGLAGLFAWLIERQLIHLSEVHTGYATDGFVLAALAALYSLVHGSRREQVVFTDQGCRLCTTYVGVGWPRYYEAWRIRGLRVDSVGGILFDDVKTGRSVAFAGEVSGLAAEHDLLVQRFPSFAVEAPQLPLATIKVHRDGQGMRLSTAGTPLTEMAARNRIVFVVWCILVSCLVQLWWTGHNLQTVLGACLLLPILICVGLWVRVRARRPGPPGESLEFTPNELRYQEIRWVEAQGGQYWHRQDVTVARSDVQGVRPARVCDGRGLTCGDLNALRISRGVEIVVQTPEETKPRTLRFANALDATESQAVLTRILEYWPDKVTEPVRQPAARLYNPKPAELLWDVDREGKAPSRKWLLLIAGLVLLYLWLRTVPWGPWVFMGGGWVGAWFVGRKLKGKFSDLRQCLSEESMLRLNRPVRIHLKPIGPDKVVEPAHELLKLGFVEVGSFFVPELPGLEVRGLLHEREPVSAVLYHKESAPCWMDLSCRYADGTSFTLTTLPASGLDERPGQACLRMVGQSPAELWARMVSDRPPGLVHKPRADNFQNDFETSYALATDWRLARGGPTESEVRAVAAPLSEEELQSTLRACHEQAMADLSEVLLIHFLQQSSPPPEEKRRWYCRVVAIHDLLSPAELGVLSVTGEGSPRQLFRAANEARPPARRWEKIGSVSLPLEADLYLHP
ncbi:hypothetical protein IV102_04075 [bacterium]|nr:hypothetical protein [bacterium]